MIKNRRGGFWILVILVILVAGVIILIWLLNNNKNTIISEPSNLALDSKGKSMICGDNICYGETKQIGINETFTFLDKPLTIIDKYYEKTSLYSFKSGVKIRIGETEKILEFDKKYSIEGIPIMLLGGGPEEYSLVIGESAWSCLEDCKLVYGNQKFKIVTCKEYTGKNSICVDFAHACAQIFKNYTAIVEIPKDKGLLCVEKIPSANFFGTACCITDEKIPLR